MRDLWILLAALALVGCGGASKTDGDAATDQISSDDGAGPDGGGVDSAASDLGGEDGASDSADGSVPDGGAGDVAADVAVTMQREDVTFPSADASITIAGTLWRPEPVASPLPAILLLHQFNQDRSQWDDLAPSLADGRVVLAVDLRGHGETSDQTGALTTVLSDPTQAPQDLAATLSWLRSRADVDPDRIGVIGTSIGANLACVAAAGAHQMVPPTLAVAFSARDTAVASLADVELGQLQFGPLYILASEDDGGGAQAATATSFFDSAGEPREQVIVAGSSHGMELAADPVLWGDVVTWIATHL